MSQDIRKTFGKTIRQMRTKEGYSQEAFADAAGLHRTYIGAIERGEQNVSLDNIQKLAQALRVNPAVFFKDFK
ncbi:MAG: helix-turn-helix transcriptional regulator [Candidatus Saccharibacteria bacterium]